MDDIVRAALRKWPSVPACYGWLGLDLRGDWYMRDEQVQAKGSFPAVKGSRLVHAQLCSFIARNYEPTPDGAWFFQNGPQRVYVELAAAPLVLGVQRIGSEIAVDTHLGRLAKSVRSTWIDEEGRLFADTDVGFGLVRSADMHCASDAVQSGRWRPQPVAFNELPQRFGYQLSPQRAAR